MWKGEADTAAAAAGRADTKHSAYFGVVHCDFTAHPSVFSAVYSNNTAVNSYLKKKCDTFTKNTRLRLINYRRRRDSNLQDITTHTRKVILNNSQIFVAGQCDIESKKCVCPNKAGFLKYENDSLWKILFVYTLLDKLLNSSSFL